jgi:phosphoserine phosphatase
LANYDAIVLDIGQADIHDTLSLGILFEIQSGSTSGPVLKIYCLKRMIGIQVKFIPISIADYEIWVKTQHKRLYYKYSWRNIDGRTIVCRGPNNV